MRRRLHAIPLLITTLSIVLSVTPPVRGQFDDGPAEVGKGVRFETELVRRYQAGITITAVGGTCQGLYGTVPVPDDWPEQEVRIVDEDFSDGVRRVRYRTLPGVKQMLVEIPSLASGQTAKALVTFEVRRRAIAPPANTSVFVISRSLPSTVRPYLGTSPYIDSRHAEIRALARKITADKESAWQQVEALYDYVRDNVENRGGNLKGALPALRDGAGNQEDLANAFIALCRAHGVPARTVWVFGFSYAEFYLHDDEDQGHWIPCQFSGARNFGGAPDHRPVLQKGDNFRVPESDPQRYVAEFLRGKPVRGGGRPRVTFVRQPLGGA